MKRSESCLAISVVVAARNEESVIGFCLDALTKQAFDLPYEIIVVDNGSHDGTVSIAKRFACTLIAEPRIGQLFAKHAGVAASKSNVVAIIDADCVPSPDWLDTIYNSFSQASGKTTVAVTAYYTFDSDLPLWAKWYVAAVRAFLVNPFRLLGRAMPFVLGGNVAFVRKSVECNGGYPIHGGIAQTELGLAKILRKSGPIRYIPEMTVVSSSRRFRYGAWYFFFKYKLIDYFLSYFFSVLRR